MICPNCHKDADFTVVVHKGKNTAHVDLVHIEGNHGPWLRDSLISRSYKAKLIRQLIIDCQKAQDAHKS